MFAGWFQPIGFPWPGPAMVWPGSVLLGAALFFTLPAVFSLTGRTCFDRLIGEFSYPIYRLHVAIWYCFQPRLLLIACIAASAPLVFLVERPLEESRNKRVHAMTMKSERRSRG